jgi:two-component system invasion response regulator UvrY
MRDRWYVQRIENRCAPLRDNDALPEGPASTPPAEHLGGAPDAADVKLVVVDDHQPFRGVVCEIVAVTPRFRVVGEAASGEEALGVVDATHPDLVLMDVRMPGIGGLQATRRLVRRHSGLVVWLVTAGVTTGLAALADACGAAAALDKRDVTPRRLCDLWDARARPNVASRL